MEIKRRMTFSNGIKIRKDVRKVKEALFFSFLGEEKNGKKWWQKDQDCNSSTVESCKSASTFIAYSHAIQKAQKLKFSHGIQDHLVMLYIPSLAMQLC